MSLFDTTLEESVYLFDDLLMNSASRTYCAIHETDPISLDQSLLVAIHNAVVETIPVQKKDQQKKQDMKIRLNQKKKNAKPFITKAKAEDLFKVFGKITGRS